MDEPIQEPIRRHPKWLARLSNTLFGWTTHYCSGGCGYPVSGAIFADIDRINETPVRVALCALEGPCFDRATTDPRDAQGTPYADFRPQLVEHIGQGEPVAEILLSLTN
jgi:hypothetical protein